MGKITLVVEGSTVGTIAGGIPAGGVQIAKEVSEQDSGRLVMAYAKTYAGRWTREDGTPRQPSIEEVLQAWFDGIVAGSIAHVKSVEQEQAAKAARDGVTDIAVA